MDIKKLLAILRAGHPIRVEELRRTAKQRQLEYARDKEVRKKEAASRTAKDRAIARRAYSQARRNEAAEAAANARMEHWKSLRKRAWILMERERQQDESLNHGIIIDAKVTTDIVEAIRWVFSNWKDLFAVTEEGARVFNEKVLEKAPSNEAVAMANYALVKPEGFFERFVIKLLPKDAGKPADDEEDKKDQLATLDPSFEEMKDFFNMDVAPERAEESFGNLVEMSNDAEATTIEAVDRGPGLNSSDEENEW